MYLRTFSALSAYPGTLYNIPIPLELYALWCVLRIYVACLQSNIIGTRRGAYFFTEAIESSYHQVVSLNLTAPRSPRPGQVLLADEATKLLHGEACLQEIHQTVKQIFAGGVGGSNAALPR